MAMRLDSLTVHIEHDSYARHQGDRIGLLGC